MKKVSESLAGRVAIFEIYPLRFCRHLASLHLDAQNRNNNHWRHDQEIFPLAISISNPYTVPFLFQQEVIMSLHLSASSNRSNSSPNDASSEPRTPPVHREEMSQLALRAIALANESHVQNPRLFFTIVSPDRQNASEEEKDADWKVSRSQVRDTKRLFTKLSRFIQSANRPVYLPLLRDIQDLANRALNPDHPDRQMNTESQNYFEQEILKEDSKQVILDQNSERDRELKFSLIVLQMLSRNPWDPLVGKINTIKEETDRAISALSDPEESIESHQMS